MKNKGKILRVKSGYNPNCSSGTWAWGLAYLCPIVGGIIGAVSIIISIILKRTHKDPFQEIDTSKIPYCKEPSESIE